MERPDFLLRGLKNPDGTPAVTPRPPVKDQVILWYLTLWTMAFMAGLLIFAVYKHVTH